MKTKYNFTLIELLIVVAIIAVLAGILLPALNSVMKKAEITKARAEIKALEIAIKQYESTYGFLPVVPDTPSLGDVRGTDFVLNDTGYDYLIADLSNTNKGSGTRANTRGMRFLGIKNPGEFLDPWENRYQIAFDTDYNGQVAKAAVDGIYDTPVGFIYSSIVVWSTGPDGITDVVTLKRDPPGSGDYVNKDNVYSFETDWKDTEGHTPR